MKLCTILTLKPVTVLSILNIIKTRQIFNCKESNSLHEADLTLSTFSTTSKDSLIYKANINYSAYFRD